VIAFVMGLLFFIPFLTQFGGIISWAVAVFRLRLPNERVALAWVGLVMSLVALFAWALGTYLLYNAGPGVAAPGWIPPPAAAPQLIDEMDLTQSWADKMSRVHKAANDFRRDYRRWPSSMDKLIGAYLRSDFALPEGFAYRPVPSSAQTSTDWILLVSTPVRYDMNGVRVKNEHCLILRLSGKIELLPVPEVEALLAVQPVENVKSETGANESE
jgi:hypothetical protein